MGVASYDGTTGKPTYNNSSTTQGDLQAAADYAASVGNHRIGTTAARTALTTKPQGLTYGDQTDGRLYMWDSVGWSLVFEPMNSQSDTTNSTIVARTQIGYGKVIGSATSDMNKTVTFPVAFSAIPVVSVNFLGYRATGAFNLSGLTGNTPPLTCAGSSVSTTAFQAYLSIRAGNLAAANDFYYSWIAIGPA